MLFISNKTFPLLLKQILLLNYAWRLYFVNFTLIIIEKCNYLFSDICFDFTTYARTLFSIVCIYVKK